MLALVSVNLVVLQTGNEKCFSVRMVEAPIRPVSFLANFVEVFDAGDEPVGPFSHPDHYSPDAPPPWDGILAAAVGLLCLGWSTFRQGKDWSALALLIGVVIFAYGCIVLLPWLADHTF